MASTPGRTSESASPSHLVDVPSGPTPVDFYNAGETYFVFASSAYLAAIASNVKDRFAQHRATFEKIQPSADAMAAFDRYAAATAALPLTKSYNDWPAEQRDTWSKELTAFCTALKPTMNDNMYFWLGYEAIRFAWAFPRDLKLGIPVQNETTGLSQGMENLVWISQQPAFSALSADVQAQVKGIIELKTKMGNMDDPIAGSSTLQASDFDDAGKKADAIRQAAKNGKLVG